MYTTIEPRLTCLFNNDVPTYTSSRSLALPPLHHPNVLRASGRPLLLEPDTSQRNGTPKPNSIIPTPHQGLLIPNDDEGDMPHGYSTTPAPLNPSLDRALGNSSPQSLHKILDDVNQDSPSAVPKKRHRSVAGKDEFVQLPKPPKKQRVAKQVVPPIIIGLFEPPPQAALFPPIASSSFHDSHGRNSLNMVPLKLGELKEAPGDEHLLDTQNEETSALEPMNTDGVRPRRRWTEEETDNLLRGVSKHGVGNWSDILEDSAFSFNKRSGTDLKDRFRTCCPDEWRARQPLTLLRLENLIKAASGGLMTECFLTDDEQRGNQHGNQYSNQDGNRDGNWDSNQYGDQDGNQDGNWDRNQYSNRDGNQYGNQDGSQFQYTFVSVGSDVSTGKPRKKRAHRKKVEDLAVLGIESPFPPSLRRDRRAFSDEEDREILEGFSIYGHAWARIQRDPHYHLQDRLPTDLRDRVRNKYPETFSSIRDKRRGKQILKEIRNSPSPTEPQLSPPFVPNLGAKGPKDASCFLGSFSMYDPPNRDGLTIEEMIATSQIPPKNLPIQPQASLESYKDGFTFHEQPTMESDAMPFSQSFDWGGRNAAPFTGTMDISRLLMDDSWLELPAPTSNGKGKQPELYEY